MRNRRAGFSLIELAAVLAGTAVLVAAAAPGVTRWVAHGRLKSAARSVMASLALARGEAIRTGNVHVVFFGLDSQGSQLVATDGTVVPLLILDDGAPGSANQNCRIDAGEPIRVVRAERDVAFGANRATTQAPVDGGGGDMATGSTFTDRNGTATSFVVFRPQGIPVSATAACVTGDPGSGAGGVYLTNGERDLAVVLTPLGTVRLHAWNGEGWTI